MFRRNPPSAGHFCLDVRVGFQSWVAGFPYNGMRIPFQGNRVDDNCPVKCNALLGKHLYYVCCRKH
ncbi:hypothetical protein ATCV1_z595R [Acanthocystis turfacea chlorella virus 1]|uniref:Uncharacterized protein z595R n=1 Tax=Chlorovirus heliozoae TaxID=322019 RepID=A7K9K5_9PHYC|nr:hypothetical protein ATCV1_z595R [Acanthocystis turfacea chlorella virus 1]ABT16729.1 hypothetical protein ATCV1_z595R [Acanthocystis turfacea chlorella virus 1]